jgi:hypothetical protein
MTGIKPGRRAGPGSPDRRIALRERLRLASPTGADGAIALTARARAARGVVPG